MVACLLCGVPVESALRVGGPAPVLAFGLLSVASKVGLSSGSVRKEELYAELRALWAGT